jgi:hypothetical protein
MGALLTALFSGPVPGVAAQAGPPAPALPTWQDTGLKVPPPQAGYCFDSSRPQVLLVNEDPLGTVAYNWATGARIVVNRRRFDVCGPRGVLFAGLSNGPAWRFSLDDPAGRPTDHLPTDVAADGTLQVYSAPAFADRLWASSDGGLTWTEHVTPEAASSTAVYGADARVLYRAGSKIFFSPDAGQTWEERGKLETPAKSYYTENRVRFVPGGPGSVNLLMLEIIRRANGSHSIGYAMQLSHDGGQSFQQVVVPGGSDTLEEPSLAYTASGAILRLQGEEIRQSSPPHLSHSTDGGLTWQSQPLPPGLPALNYDYYMSVLAVPFAPTNVFLRAAGRLFYSPDSGEHWQHLPDYSNNVLVPSPSVAPYLPLTLLDVREGRLHTLTLPQADARQAAPVAASGAPGSRFFPTTGHNLAAVFAPTWERMGGLAQQGYPLTEAAPRVAADGRVYWTQLFERAVFEYHPEQAPPYDVLLSLLGTAAYRQRYGDGGAPAQQASTANPHFFAETGHTLGGTFRAYWEGHGGLAQQGYPISDEFTEVSDLDGKAYTVQYFQRARFEYHPENAGTPYEVLLGRLGAAQVPAVPAPAPATAHVSRIRSLALAGPDSGWAAAQLLLESADGAEYAGSLLRYQAGAWTVEAGTITPGQELRSVTLLPSGEGWAVGDNRMLHYQAGRWAPVPLPRSASLTAVAMAGPDDGWAFGNSLDSTFTGAFRYRNGTWQADKYVLYGVTGAQMLTSQDGWAVRGSFELLHWDGTAWQGDQHTPNYEHLVGLSMTSARDGWAVGERGALDHWNGRQWIAATSPVTTTLTAVQMQAPESGWAVGAGGAILRYAGGAWTRAASPTTDDLDTIALAGVDTGWAGGADGTLLHYQAGVWQLYAPLPAQPVPR